MSRIPAEQNLVIEIDNQRWRLLADGDGQEHVLVEAAPGQPLRYLPLFASKRHLPETGVLPVDRVQRVVLGWSGKDGAWHLGLMLEPDLADARGSRWCEMAHWIDPDRSQRGQDATVAGEQLAQSMTRPFNVIPPRDEVASPLASPSSLPVTAPLDSTPTYGSRPVQPSAYENVAPYAAPAVYGGPAPYITPAPYGVAPIVDVPQRELPALPILLDQWTLELAGDQILQLRLTGGWGRSRVVRVIWYAFWAVVYVVLSVLTLRGGIALPKPEFLPYLGLASALVLLLIILYTFGQLLTKIDHVVFDGGTREVRGLHGDSERWHVSEQDLESIYVSQVVSKRGKPDKRTVHHSEINLHCADGHFVFLVANMQTEVKDITFDDTPLADGVMPLTPNLVYSDAQAAAAHIAAVLGVPCWYDQHLH